MLTRHLFGLCVVCICIGLPAGHEDFVIDALALHDHIGEALRPSFSSSHITKVLVACDTLDLIHAS